MKFNLGDCVLHKLTGEHVLVLDRIKYPIGNGASFVNGYYIRTNDYDVIKVTEFELTERILQKEVI